MKTSLYALSLLGGIQLATMAEGVAQVSGSVTLPAYGGKSQVAEMSLADLINKCDELERHEQVAKFNADVTCRINQQIWAPGQPGLYATDFEPFFAEFDLNVKGKFNSDWIPLHDARQPFTDSCQSVEQWQIMAMKSIKVHSCNELRAVKANPTFCEDLFGAGSCIDTGSIHNQIRNAQQAQQKVFADRECQGERMLEVATAPSSSVESVQAQAIPSGEQQFEVQYENVTCSQASLPVNVVLRTVDIHKAGTTVQAVQLIDQGELQDKNLRPGHGGLSIIAGQLPKAKDILWRVNGRRVESAEEACQLLGDAKGGLGNGLTSPFKISFYSATDLEHNRASLTINSAARKHLLARY